MRTTELVRELRKYANAERRKVNMSFFRTGKGEYGEGDRFIGLTVPHTREVAKKFRTMPLSSVEESLHSPLHEVRLAALLILAEKYEKSNTDHKEQIFRLYERNFKYVNNWDLVDLSAPKIPGPYLYFKGEKKLYQWAKTKHLWTKRIAVMSTFFFIRQGNFQPTFKVSEILLKDEHDLIHKAVGWMLREVGKRDRQQEEEFLRRHYHKMPRTMLRYAIEKFPEKKRKAYLQGRI